MTDDLTKRPLPRSAPEGQSLILVLPDGNIRPVPAIWMATEEDEFHGLRQAEIETGGRLVYVPEINLEGVPHHELPRYDIGSGTFLPPDPKKLRAEWVRQAREKLDGTDWVLAKVTEEGLILSAAWRQWRQSLRDIINGADGPVADEPERWGQGAPGAAPEPVVIPAFLKDAEPPADIADLFEPAETPPEAHNRLTAKYNDAKQRAELARTYGGTFDGKSVVEWERKAERYESGLKWNRGRMAEQL